MSTPGHFVWFDIMAHDKDKARAFYTSLFDWDVDEADMGPMGMYPMFRPTTADASGAVGGAVEIEEAQRATLPSHWINYIVVEDCDATLERVKQHGGSILQPAFDVPDVGRMAVCADPQGAVFSPMQEANPGPEPDMPSMWQVCWNELMTSDPDAATAFYTEVFGYSAGPGPTEGYVTLMTGERPQAGLMKSPMDDAPPHWLTYIWVDDIEARAKKVTDLGGQVVAPPSEVPTVGTIAVCLDNQGAAFGIFQR